MEKRKLGNTGLEASIIGLGIEHLDPRPPELVEAVVREAVDRGINYIDIITHQAATKEAVGRAIQGRREQVVLAAHLGMSERDGQYYKTRDVQECEDIFRDLLPRLGTDYVDIIHLHNVDEESDLELILKPGSILDLAKRLQAEGKARFIGLSGHAIPLAMKVLDAGCIDLLMFPVNMLWNPAGRMEVAHACATRGVALVAMKPFAGGELFQPNQAGTNLPTPVQCLSYALSQAGVATAATGVKSLDELQGILAYLEASDEEKDYSEMIAARQQNMKGICVYCNHCLPCPVGINVGETLRAARTAEIQVTPQLQSEYAALPAKASACLECGDCVTRCPFGVDVIAKMNGAVELLER